MAFWQERVRTATVAQSRTSYSSFVDSSTPENQIAYDLNIDRNLNFIETESADEALESSSAAMTPLIDNNASSSTINNQMPTTSWIIGNINTTNLFPQYRRHVNTIDLFFPLETSPAKMKIFGQRTLSDVWNQVLGEMMPVNAAKISDSYFINVIDIIETVDSKAISGREGKRDLLNFAATMNDTIGNVTEGLANLLTKLPRLQILDSSKITEVEL
ncbi:hypothetical protein MFLAVUS_001550 [Mucor flavus]|uniref:Uncharacterized protein n=1 Tax=Mucor flavus TaxID=439312 RepID=A0ABP9YMT3_9FUNG